MPKQPVREQSSRFELTKAMGLRLREIRKRSGLTQLGLAKAMGRQGSGGHYLVGRLERADVANPTLGLVADFLRACRAGFDDLSDLLKEYTSLPPVAELAGRAAVEQVAKNLPPKIAREVRKRDRGAVNASEATGRRLPSPAQRQAQARRAASMVFWRQRVRERVRDACAAGHWALGALPEEHLRKYGVKVWAILSKTRGEPQAVRDGLLAEAEAGLLSHGKFDPAHVRAVQAGVVDLFRRAEVSGGIEAPAAVGSTKAQAAARENARLRAWESRNIERRQRIARLWAEIEPEMTRAGVKPEEKAKWQGTLASLCTIAESTRPGSSARQQQVDELADAEPLSKSWRKPAIVRRLAELAMPRWDEMVRPAPGAQ